MTFVKLYVSGDAWTLAQKLVCMCDYFSLFVYDFVGTLEHGNILLCHFGPPLSAGQLATHEKVALKCAKWVHGGKHPLLLKNEFHKWKSMNLLTPQSTQVSAS